MEEGGGGEVLEDRAKERRIRQTPHQLRVKLGLRVDPPGRNNGRADTSEGLLVGLDVGWDRVDPCTEPRVKLVSHTPDLQILHL